ncbi:MAG: sulfotransferase family protein [Frankiaceae bacterium]
MVDGSDAGERPAPIFIVGSLGSGSTLLRLMLDSHARIAIPQETGFMRAVLANEWIPFWKFGGEWYGRLGLGEDELRARLADFYGGLFHDYAAAQGKARWGDKTPFHVWHMTEILRLFPDAVFIGTVRHPGGVVASLHNRFGYDWARSVRHWVRINARLTATAAGLGDRFLLCRYEQLVREPEPLMRGVLDWLGEPWDPRVLAHHEVQRARGAPARVEGHTRTDQALDVRRIDAWTADLDEPTRALLRELASPLARFLGYDVDDPTRLDPLDRLGPSGPGPAVTGAALDRRRAEFPGIDWSHPPAPALENQLLTPELLDRLPAGAGRRGGRGPLAAARLGRRLASRLPEPARAPLRRLARRVRRRAA